MTAFISCLHLPRLPITRIQNRKESLASSPVPTSKSWIWCDGAFLCHSWDRACHYTLYTLVTVSALCFQSLCKCKKWIRILRAAELLPCANVVNFCIRLLLTVKHSYALWWSASLWTAFEAVQYPHLQVLGLVCLYSTYFLSSLHPTSLSCSSPCLPLLFPGCLLNSPQGSGFLEFLH